MFNYHAGNFRLTQDNQVIAKSGGKILSIGILTEPLEKIPSIKIKSFNNKTGGQFLIEEGFFIC